MVKLNLISSVLKLKTVFFRNSLLRHGRVSPFPGNASTCTFRYNWTKATISAKKLQIGDPLPDINLYENSPDNAIPASELYKGKKGVLFAVVGAFTPGCTNSHIPDYLSLYEKFKEEGYMISCVAVNDPFVMKAWAESTHADGKIRMLADPRGEFTKALGMELDCKSSLGGIRSHKYSLAINDGIVQGINVDPEHTGLVCLLCIRSMSLGNTPKSS